MAVTLQASFCATLVDEWVRAGVTQAVISPGSRSTPLATALAADGRMTVAVVLDERSAAFVALGVGLRTGRPAVVLTTSGTATANLPPAVVEAHQARVPLLVCTADRPPELHHVGAPQTIEQERLFDGCLRWMAGPGVADPSSVGSWRSVASRAVAEAVGGPDGPGPVHLNLAFREPLVGEPGPLPEGRPDAAPWHRLRTRERGPSNEVVAELAGQAAGGRRGVIVAGAGAGAGGPWPLQQMADALGWPVLADPRSDCRVPHATTVAAADALLRSPTFVAHHRPEVVLRLGAPWASRVVGEWLADLAGPQYLVDPHGAWLDPSRTASTVVRADPGALSRAITAVAPPAAPDGWLASWAAAEARAQRVIDEHLSGEGPALNEPAIARTVCAALPDGATLMVSSSMPVRDVECFGRPRVALSVLANRGANGIDGVISTAAGVSRAGRGPTALLIGDLAFLHDVGGLAAVGRTDLTIVVVDNGGGGIFSFLPQATHMAAADFEQLLGTPHGLDLLAVARAFGIDAAPVASLDELAAALAETPTGPRVLVATTDRAANVAVHRRINQAVVDAFENPSARE